MTKRVLDKDAKREQERKAKIVINAKKHSLVEQGHSLPEEIVIGLLRMRYPGLKLVRNDKSVLGRQEIDIHLPDYKVAIEVDGIWHSKAIYGEERFLEAVARDRKKDAALAELQYHLFRIDIGEVPKNDMLYFLKDYVKNTLGPELDKLIKVQAR